MKSLSTHPRAKSTTTLSKSSTSKPKASSEQAYGLDTPVQFVKGVGPRLGAIFASRDILRVKDLLTFFPRAYEDRTKLLRVSELVEGLHSTVAVRIISSRKIPTRTGRSIFEVRTSDSTGMLSLKWFHLPRGMDQRFVPGTQIIVTGLVKMFMGKPEIIHPEITWGVSSDTGSHPQSAGSGGDPVDLNTGRVVPIYTEIEGIPSRTLRKVLWEALEKYSSAITEDLPERFLLKHGLPRQASAIRNIHFPPESATSSIQDLVNFNTPSHWRLVYEEFFKFEYLILRRRLRMEREKTYAIGSSGGRAAVIDLQKNLPFQLTAGQQRALDEILQDFCQPHPMNRLVQGDVGSGKTVVAFLSAGCALAEGGQVALMAPTEILAEQHHKTATQLLSGKLNVALLTGKTPQSERNRLIARLKAGEPLLVIGTHALIEDPIEFANLVYVIVDEQHRFGVEQRRALRKKGIQNNTIPHSLLMTATPIPRTLALTVYGDLTVSTIKELPPGRSPVITHVIQTAKRTDAYEKIREQLRQGRQAYFIYPLINESEAEGFTALKSAVAEADRLAHDVFPEFKVGLLHGQMKPEEKAAVMERFQKNELQILVSTTVVEVGVDVPNATVMGVEHAERFGLSQLHQLRGRVGRGQHQSHCFLFAASRVGEITAMRLDVLEDSHDGFKIAEADLEIRGPGEFLGTRQAGGLPFRLAHLVRDREWLLKAREDVSQLIKEDPELVLPEQAPLRKYNEREGHIQFEHLKTS